VFAGATLAIGLAGVLLAQRSRLVPIAVAAGAIGVMLAASVFSYGGQLLATAASIGISYRARIATMRRIAAVAAVLLVVGGGVAFLRGGDISSYLSFLGVQPTPKSAKSNVQTGVQRTMLSYIGLRIWEAHPWFGVGFERSGNRYQPYLAAAKRKFPNEPPLAFPSKVHEWGIQDFWLQLLADTGIVGFVLGVGTFATAIALALHAPATLLWLKLVAGGWVLVAAGTWLGEGIVAGIPLEAVTWLGFGLCATVGAVE